MSILEDAISELKAIIMINQVLARDEKCSDEKKELMEKINIRVNKTIKELEALRNG